MCVIRWLVGIRYFPDVLLSGINTLGLCVEDGTDFNVQVLLDLPPQATFLALGVLFKYIFVMNKKRVFYFSFLHFFEEMTDTTGRSQSEPAET